MSDRLVIVENGSSSVALRGEIDAHSAPALAERFATLPTGDDDVVIDMAFFTGTL